MREFEHDVSNGFREINDGLTFLATACGSNSKEAGKEDDLEHILTGHGIHDICRDDVHEHGHMIDAFFSCISDSRTVSGLNGNSDTGLEYVDNNQTNNESNGRSKLKPEN